MYSLSDTKADSFQQVCLSDGLIVMNLPGGFAGVLKLVDKLDLGSSASCVWVRLPSPAQESPLNHLILRGLLFRSGILKPLFIITRGTRLGIRFIESEILPRQMSILAFINHSRQMAKQRKIIKTDYSPVLLSTHGLI